MSGQDDDAGGDTPAAVAEASPPPAPAPVDATPPPSSGAAPVSLDSPMWTETAKNKLENLKRISETRESLAKAKALSLNVVLPANPGAVRAARPVVPPSTDEVEKRKQWAAQQKAFEERRLKLVADREAQAHAEAKAKEEARLAAVRQTVQERLAKQQAIQAKLEEERRKVAEGAAQRTKYLKENPTRLYRQLEEDFAMKVQLEEEAKARYYKEEMGKYRRARPSDIINGNVVVRAPSPRGGRAASPGSAGRGPTLPFAFGSAAPGNRSPPGSASPMRRSTEIPGYDVAAYTQASSPSRRVPVDYLPNPRLYKPSSPGTSAGGASPPAHQQAVAVEEVVPTKTVFVFGHHTRIPASQEGAGPPRSRSPSPRGGRSIGSASPARSSSMMSGGESGHPGDRRSLTMSAGPHISSMAAMRASIHEDVTSNLGAFQHQDAEPAAKPKAKPASPRPKQAAARPTPTAAAPRAPAPAAAPAPPAAPPPQSPPPEAVQSQRSASPLVAETEPEQQESQVAAAAAEEEQAPAAAAAADTPPPPAPAPQPAGMDNDESATIIQSALRAKMDRDRVSKKAAEAAARPAPAKQAAAPPPADAPAPPPPAAAEEDVKPAATDAADNGDDVGAAAPVSPSAADADMLGSLMSADESAVIIQSAMRAKLDNEEVSAKLRARAE